jgi:hypothetical protein
MAILFTWLNLGAWILVLLLCLAVYFDSRGERRTLAAWRSKADARLAALEGAVFPPPATPPPQLPPPLARTATQGRAAVPPPAPREGPQSGTRPSKAPRDEAPPTPPRTAPDDARAALHTSDRPPPPVEVVEPASVQRDAAPTSPATVRLTPMRPTLFGGVVGGPAADPSWGERRMAELAEHAREAGEPFKPEEARQQAPREGRSAGTPLPPTGEPTLDARAERLWHQKITAADEAGENVVHCYGAACFHDGEAISACACDCDGCVLVGELLIAAHREITGRE